MRDWDRRRRSERRDSEGEGVRRIPCVVVSSEQNPEISGAPAAWRWGIFFGEERSSQGERVSMRQARAVSRQRKDYLVFIFVRREAIELCFENHAGLKR